MAWIETNYEGGNFNIVSEMKGKKIKISTRTTNRIIAEAMKQKISDLEAAYMCGLSLDECGLAEWCNLFSKHNPDAFNTLERSGLVFSAKDNEKSIEISEEQTNINDSNGKDIIISNEHFFVRVLPDRDKMIFSHFEGGQYLHVYLTKKTAEKHGIKKGLKSYTFGDEVRLNERAPCRAATWKENSGLLRYYSQRGYCEGLTQIWEMFEAVFTDDNKIVRGQKIACHEDKYIGPKVTK